MRRVQKNAAKRGVSWPLLTVLGAAMLGIVVIFAKNLLRAPPAVSWQGLVDQNGRALDDQLLGGQYKLVFFGFTQCASVCPVTLVKLRAVLDTMGPKRASLSPLFVTVDPDHDSPSVLRSYTAAIDDRIVGVTGETAIIDRFAAACGVYALRHPGESGPASVEHSARIYLMAPDNTVLISYEPSQSTREIVRDLAQRIEG